MDQAISIEESIKEILVAEVEKIIVFKEHRREKHVDKMLFLMSEHF